MPVARLLSRRLVLTSDNLVEVGVSDPVEHMVLDRCADAVIRFLLTRDERALRELTGCRVGGFDLLTDPGRLLQWPWLEDEGVL